MKVASHIRIAIAAATCAAVAAPAALGAGEPKNQAPFTRPAGDAPDRYLAAQATNDPAGEPKDQPPFVRAVSSTPLVVQSSGGGFDWGDAGIGAGVALGFCGLAAGALAARGGTTRPRTTGA
ncbi:MAG TPA: hypothetical protein VFB35_06660 [Gaiellaceae bacterium]|nr:hypothetical protein [Gaiellaceae bacterium]